MDFEPIYYPDKINILNPKGDVGVITLWSPVKTVLSKLEKIEPKFISKADSRIAVISNLYGDGMLHMFCNLLYNPQIKYLVALGQDMGLPTCHEIEQFLEAGLEDGNILGQGLKRVVGTQRLLRVPEGFDVSILQKRLSFSVLGKLSAKDFIEKAESYFSDLPPQEHNDTDDRIEYKIQEASADDFSYMPSDPLAHTVTRKRPLDCWEELVFRVMKFGRPLILRKGPRIELQNVKVVISEPVEEKPKVLEDFGFSYDRFKAYQKKIMDPEIPENVSYTYGNRIRGYYEGAEDNGQIDCLAAVIKTLREDKESRHCYISLWDTKNDLRGIPREAKGGSVPCLATLFFRVWENKLTLTANYRSHNLLTAWLENVYGLMAIQRHVAEACDIETGEITVISHSLTINPREARFPVAEEIMQSRKKDDEYDRETGKYLLREDPHGYFSVTTDPEAGHIIVEHKHQNVTLNRYYGRKSREIEEQLSRDMAVSLVSHALYLGRQLAEAERALAVGKSANKKTRVNAE